MPSSPASRTAALSSLLWALPLLAACAGPAVEPEPPALHYVGSSTVGHFIRDVDGVYEGARFVIDTKPESAGGEAAILSGLADLAGCAERPSSATLAHGVVATLIGQDAIAAIVHLSNPVRALTREELRALFTGRIRRWSELGGRDLPVHAYVVAPESATRRVFRSAVLGPEDYAGCTVVRPDARMIEAVARDPGGIGQISLAFLDEEPRVVALAVDGEAPRPDNAHYPVTRPLYLLWWPERRRVADFIAWTRGPEAAEVLLRRFALPPPAAAAERPRVISARGLFGLAPLGLAACAAPAAAPPGGPPANLRYVGSSTVATFVREAEPVYGWARFELDTRPESAGGIRAILERTADLAGVADRPGSEVLRAGVAATLIGRDAIAVIVHADNPLAALTSSDLRGIFTGRIERWSELGGTDIPIEPLITGAESATHRVFRDAILRAEDYAGCRVVRPDWEIIAEVAQNPGAIGHISFSFLDGAVGVRALAVDGERPSVTNFSYSIARPLYLLHWEGNAAVDAFVAWSTGEAGQRVVMRHFVGTHVVGSAESAPVVAAKGTLVVYTATSTVNDGGIYYYPHRSYELLTRDGDLLRRVRNHRGQNDETPTRIALAPGTYLIRPDLADGSEASFFVTIEGGRVTTIDVAELLGADH